MPTPTHSGKCRRIGLAASFDVATDRVIGAGSISAVFRPIEARQGIILGKSGPSNGR
jgi:hypothetical protein